MDPVTHAASGAVAMLALPRRPLTRWALPLAAMATASPDLDILFAHTPLQFLLLHRGISHSFAAMPVFGLALALCCRPLWNSATPDRWSFTRVWLLCCALILLHIWLDVVTTYGTMVFLPFSHYRVRLNSIYIIDLFLTVPLLWAVWRLRARRGLILLALAWVFVYPLLGMGINAWHTVQSRERLLHEGRAVSRLHVLPDAFAPFFWRVIFEEGETVRAQSLDALGRPRAAEAVHRAAPAPLVAALAKQSVACDSYFRFAMLPVMDALRPGDAPPPRPGKTTAPEEDGHAGALFYDLRFGSGLALVRRLLAMRPNADIPFQLMVELAPAGRNDGEGAPPRLERLRLRFSDSGRDSRWHAPEPPAPPTFPQWLAGLR